MRRLWSTNLFLSLSLWVFVLFSGCSSTVQQQLDADQYLKRAQILARDFQYREALQYYAKARQIYQTVDSSQIPAAILYNTGNLYYELQEYETALKYYELSLQSSSSLEKEYQIRTFNNLGVIYRSLGRYDDALEYFDNALKIIEPASMAKTRDFDKEYFMLHLNKAVVQIKSDHPQKALDILDQLSASGDNKEHRYEIALTQAIKGIIEARHFHNIRKALEDSHQALIIFEDLDREYDKAFVYHNIGRLYAERQEYQKAIRYYRQSLTLCQTIGDQETAWLTYYNLGNVYRDQANFTEALQNYSESIRIIESIRSKLRIDDFKTSFLNDKIDVYKAIIDLLVERGQKEEAFHYLERAKSRALVDLLSHQRIVAGEGVDERLLKEKEQADDRIRNVLGKLREEYSQSQEKRDRVFRLTGELRQEQQNYRKLLHEIQTKNPEYASLISVNPPNLQEIQRLIPERAAFLEYVILEEKTLMFIVTRHELQIKTVDVSQKSLQATVFAFRIDIEREIPGWQGKSRWLYSNLIAPAEKQLQGIDTLCIIPYGVLHYLPFGTLFDNMTSQLLLEQYDLFYAPSSSVLTFAFDKGNKYPPGLFNQHETQDPFLFVANPDGSLGYAEEEVQQIQQLYHQSKVLVKSEATEGAVKDAIRDYRVIHFAAHGLLDPVQPLFSALILADGVLEVHEIFNELELDNCRLVTLSACNTALGKRTAGDEMIGLTRAFIYAGAPSVVASLWAVDDRSTALLMQRFYRNLSEENRAKALKQAQVSLFHDPEYPIFQHPYYWAAFELIGDYR
ncbi:MAG: CHAT domain-containing protein [bacterium]|nr:CHAT domain-containing protein [bacterium]